MVGCVVWWWGVDVLAMEFVQRVGVDVNFDCDKRDCGGCSLRVKVDERVSVARVGLFNPFYPHVSALAPA